MLYELHDTPIARHSWFTKTYDQVKRSFLSDGMKHDVFNFVAKFDVCQWKRGETIKSPGTLQPLPIPPDIWQDISMDFIVGLPKSGNKSVIMVVFYRLSRYAHVCALQTTFIESIVAQLFMDQVFKLHGMPHSIVSDRDPTFTSNFWQEKFKLQGTQNMKMKGPFFLSPSLYQIGSKLFTRNGYTIRKVHIWYNNCSPIIQFP